jgi:hypothetical protein
MDKRTLNKNLKISTAKTIRTLPNTSNSLTLSVSRELKKIGYCNGDFVNVMVENGFIIIKPLSLKGVFS